jgi:ATP synthase protein I
MQAESTNSGEMSQGSKEPDRHRNRVFADPIAHRSRRAYNALSASSVGLELGLSVAIGLLIGWWMDQHLGTTPWLMLAWLVFGSIAGFRGVVRAVKRADRAAEQEEARG